MHLIQTTSAVERVFDLTTEGLEPYQEMVRAI